MGCSVAHRFKPGEVVDANKEGRGTSSDSSGSDSDSSSSPSTDSTKYEAADSVYCVLLGKVSLATREAPPRPLRVLEAGDVIHG